MRVLVDSSVWIGFLRGADTRQTRLLRDWLTDAEGDAPDLVLGDLILCELLRGAPDERSAALLRERLAALDPATLGGEDAAVRAAALDRALRGTGVTVRGAVDLLIAAWCIAEGAALLQDDRDFAAMAGQGLRLV